MSRACWQRGDEALGEIVQITVTLPLDTEDENPARWAWSGSTGEEPATITLTLDAAATSVTGTATLTPADNHDSDITLDITAESIQTKTGVTPSVVYTISGTKVKITDQDGS